MREKTVLSNNLSFCKEQIVKLIVFLNWKIQSCRKVKDCYITYSGGWDGAGAQIHSIVSIIVFSKKMNITYLHNPIKNIEHFKGDRAIWSQKWEDFFSLGKSEFQLKDISLNRLKRKHLKYPSLLWKRKNTIFDVSNCHQFLNTFPNCYNPFLEELKENFWVEKINSKKKNLKVLHIGIHIRRGDVKREDRNPLRFTSNDYIIQKLDLVVGILKNLDINYKVLIFSQGSEKDFSDFEKFNPILRINEDEFNTFIDLVKSDIIIMAKSSFSYLAALLSKGLILYEPFWHRALSEWIIFDEDGNFLKILRRKLLNRKDVSL